MSKEIASKLLETATKLGWTVGIRRSILTISKPISSNDDFVSADSEYYSILGLLTQTSPGSSWGTDGGGIGALSAMKHGLFVMNKSGGSKRILNELAKLI